MEHTLVAVFDSDIHAQNALDALALSGFSRSDMHINAAQPGAMPGGAASGASDLSRDESIGDRIKGFFSNLFAGADQTGHADMYSEAVKRGRFVLTVVAHNEDQLALATGELNRHSPIDVEDRAQGGTQEAQGGGVRVFPRTAGQPAQGSAPLADDAVFRNHWQSSYAQSGGRYEDYAPAYQYGSSLGAELRYRGRQWEDIEPQARTEWESTHADSPWERTKEAVRAGWERVAGKSS